MKANPTVIVVCGATATGKTDLAFALAQELQAEIISFDSIQVYKKLDIGGAKPPRAMLDSIRHHLIDELDPAVPFTAGDFRRRALEEIDKLKAKKYVVLVGGTGFYLQALLKGMYAVPDVSLEVKKQIELELQEKGSAALFALLTTLDPAHASSIHQNDSYRVSRALELLRSGVKKVSEIKNQFAAEPLINSVVLIGLRRKKEVLKAAIAQRTEKMLQDGLIEETEKLLAEYPQGLRALSSVGYRETVEYLSGMLRKEELASAITQSTIYLAKRQNTWFKREPNTRWFDPDEEGSARLLLKAKQLLSALVNG